jgi:hypothetical protein
MRGAATSQMAESVVRPALKKSQQCTTSYGAYISHHFPVTVCEPMIPDLNSSVATMAAAAPNSRGTLFMQQLWSALDTKPFGASTRFGRFQNCRTFALPFIGRVETTQNCDDSLPDSSVLEVYGHPELTRHWTGGINEIPPPYNPDWFGVTGHSCRCCAGFVDCFDGRCLPRGSSCSQHPV